MVLEGFYVYDLCNICITRIYSGIVMQMRINENLANIYMKKYSLISGEIQVKSLRYHHISITILNIKKTDNVNC